MPYAITETGWRSINEDMALLEGEAYVEEIPQSLLDACAAAAARRDMVRVEDDWRELEISAINNQLMAIEEAEATGEDAGALPGTRLQWLQYRTKVRNWKDGAEFFPDLEYRPDRPS
ncbi:hypothetical protein [Pseudomonas fluorescens]|uniref:Phage tail protein n=1 Tax=Pseudomonas fluorescens TaxID=294 RepID=A0A5E7N7R8_PSEFL|nr:hypothetical protein [Pseudomonas fluorescens]VVP33112.1 hypothetical protein PS880_04444 [Pseudomonas fluorescens]